MAEIRVRALDEETGAHRFEVTVAGPESTTVHTVTVSDDDMARLGAAFASPEDLVRASFEFLLEREPNESILRSFDLSVIPRYFSDYEREITRPG